MPGSLALRASSVATPPPRQQSARGVPNDTLNHTSDRENVRIPWPDRKRVSCPHLAHTIIIGQRVFPVFGLAIDGIWHTVTEKEVSRPFFAKSKKKREEK